MKVKDRFGHEFGVGDSVLFTKAVHGGIYVGEVVDIYESQPYSGTPITKVRVKNLNDDGTQMMEKEYHYDKNTGRRWTTESHLKVRDSILDYDAYRFVLYN